MARQDGILRIKGTLGGMTFYKSQDGDLVKTKSAVDGNRIASDPAFARTRENGAEFGAAGTAGKLLRDALRSMMMNVADNRVTSRVTQKMTEISKLDTASTRGNRVASVGLGDVAGKALLKGFEFNINAILKSILFKPYAVATATGVITINGLVPINDVAFPAGATHMTLSGAFADIDFATGGSEVEFTNKVNLPIDGVSTDVVLTPAAVPAEAAVKLYLLKVEFFQLVNAVQYSLKSGAFNAMAIVEVA
jgi:hypothetical protein